MISLVMLLGVLAISAFLVVPATGLGLLIVVVFVCLALLLWHLSTRPIEKGWRPDASCPSPRACRRECIYNGCNPYASERELRGLQDLR